MNKNSGTEIAVYKITALVIFIVLLTFMILITVTTVMSKSDNDSAHFDTSPSTDPAPHTQNEPDMKEPLIIVPATVTEAQEPELEAVTDPAPAIEIPETDTQTTAVSAPVSVPSANVADDLAEFLAGYPDTVLGVTEDAGKEYIDKLIFLGDSTTYGLRHYEMLEGGKKTLQVWTPASGTLTLTQASFTTVTYPDTGEELTIKAAVEKKKPEYLVITLGVNGISFMNEDYFKSEYKKLIESVKEVSPDTKIICQSMFPVARSYGKLESINNDKIRSGNRWIVEVAAETGVKFIDTYSALADSEGWLPEAYHNGDGMHLCTESFTVELNNLRTHAFE